LFGFFKTKTPTSAFTVESVGDRFGIVERTANGKYRTQIVHGVYTRKADAIRGATRKGITLANA
jgi:hypothetical protein